MLQVGSREQSRAVAVDVTDGRWVSLDIGPFDDQGDLLHFAMLLEQVPGVSQLDLLDADPDTALFAVRFRSAAEFSSLLGRLPDYRIRATTLANMVSAQIVPGRGLAGVLLLPATAGGMPGVRARWWARAAGATAAAAAAVGVLYVTLTGGADTAVSPVATRASATPTPVASAFVSVPMSPAVATPTVAALRTPASTPAAPTAAVPAATASPASTPPVTPTPTPTPTRTPSPTAVPARVARYGGPFTTSLGTVRATNGCQWDVRIDGNLEVALTPGGATRSGPASMDGSIVYLVRDTPPGATCNATTAAVVATGSAGGGDTIETSLTGARELVVRFTGAVRDNDLAGDLRLDRTITTVSSFGNTSETRTGSVSGITLARID